MTSQRPRTGRFHWARFTNLDAPARPLTVTVKPNVKIMEMLTMYQDEDLVREWIGRIMEKRRHIIQGGGQQVQTYDQKDMRAFAPDDYQGTTKIGRAYAQCILPHLPSVILNTIYKETHMEIDMRSSFTTMLTQLFSDVNTPTLNIYARNPDAIYNRLRNDLNMDKATTKKVINSIICSHPNVAEDPAVGNWAEISRNDLMEAVRFEVGLWARALRSRYPLFVEMVSNKCVAEGKRDHIDGTALFYAACDMEHAVMRSVISLLCPSADDIVWKYDGVLVPMRRLAGKTHEQWVEDLHSHILDTLMLDVQFAVKSLHENSYGICLGPDEDRGDNGLDPYQRWKAVFDRKYKKCLNPPVFMMMSRDGKRFIDLKKTDFEHNTAEEPPEFIKRWVQDPDKDVIEGRGVYPPPHELPRNHFNLYHGMAAAELLPNDGEVDIERYLKHVHLLMGSNDDNAAYMHKLIAQKIQKPGLKWRVMPIIMSTQGVGKDIWFDFLADIVGTHQCLKVDGVHKLTTTNSGQLEGKLLCCLQEMGYKDTKDNEEYLKALITNTTVQLEQKYVRTFHTTNVVDLIGFTNNFNAINVPPGERRYFIVIADSTYAQKVEYMQPLLAFFNDDRKKRAVYDYYLGMDLEGFDSSADRPITDAHKEATEANISFIDRFLHDKLPDWKTNDHDFTMRDHDTLRVKCSYLISDFMDYAREMGTKNAENRGKMQSWFLKEKTQLGARTHEYVTANHKTLVDTARSNRAKFYDIDLVGMEAYLLKVFDEAPADTEEPELAARAAHYRDGFSQFFNR